LKTEFTSGLGQIWQHANNLNFILLTKQKDWWTIAMIAITTTTYRYTWKSHKLIWFLFHL